MTGKKMPLTKDALNVNMQQVFEKIQRDSTAMMKTALDPDKLENFHLK